jgi:diacylglycerol kinase (ATP)
MKPMVILLNPAAGHGNGARLQPVIESAILNEGLDAEIIITARHGHAIELARQAALEGARVVVSAGGDGTLNEVVNGLMSSGLAADQLPVLGVICAGRGNDFAGSVGIPEDVAAGFRLLKSGQTRLIDIGRAAGGIYPEGHYFINVVGVGFDVIATIEAAKMPRWGGFFSFLLAALKTIFLYNHAPMASIEHDGETLRQRSLMISLMNGRRLGGKFIMAPDSKPDDGLLDLCIAEQMASFKVLALLPHFFDGSQGTQKGVKTARAAHIQIDASDGPLPAHMDGEIFCTEGRSLTVDLLSTQIRVICPPVGGSL